ncbi:MAG: DUF4351 domain-containing protein [Nitrososphaera sp.]
MCIFLRQNKYLDFLAYYFNLGEKEWEVYRAHKQKKNEEKEFEMITTILREQAEAAGKLKQGQHMLLLLLPKRFGPMPPEIESLIRGLTDLDRIDAIMTSFLEIRDWSEVKELLQSA